MDYPRSCERERPGFMAPYSASRLASGPTQRLITENFLYKMSEPNGFQMVTIKCSTMWMH